MRWLSPGPVLFASILVGACVSAEDPSGDKLPHPPVEQCAAYGGTIREPDNSGWELAPRCIVDTPDGGRRCTDNSQCTGRCIFTGDDYVALKEQVAGDDDDYGFEDDYPRPGTRAIGSCERSNFMLGCFAEVRRGRLTHYVCQD